MTEQIRILGQKQVEMANNRLTQCLQEPGKWQISFNIFQQDRSFDQNSAYWMWLTKMAVSFSRRGRPTTKDELHDLMRHKFLGYMPKRKFKSKEPLDIPLQLKSTTDLSKLEMSEYMVKVEAWGIENGCMPECFAIVCFDYEQYKEARQ